MRSILNSFCILIVALLVCSPQSDVSFVNLTVHAQSSKRDEFDLPRVKLATAKSPRRTDSLQERIEAYAQRSGLAYLRSRVLGNNESEIRYWVGFGLFEPRCFVYRHGADLSALYFSIDPGKDSVAFQERKLNFSKHDPNWFSNYLNRIRIYSLPFRADKVHVSDPDEELVVLEVKDRTAYKIIYFPVSTRDKYGRRIVELGREIEQVFGAKLFL